MAFAPSDFIGAFPEFTTTPTGQISFWLTQAYATLDPTRFGAQLDLAASLFTAHNLVLSARDIGVASRNGVPGDAAGPIVSKAVRGLSKSYATTTAIDGAGIWNGTSYGQRLYQMMRVAGLGGGSYVGKPMPAYPYGYSVYQP